MRYKNIVQATFVDRPNRFIAHVCLDEKIETVHVKNTGRCRELLIPGALVYLEKSDNPSRTTAYDLVAVKKGGRIINMDSQAPNKVVEEWLLQKELFPDLVLLRPETKYGNSRFDFYVETEKSKIFIEVKGVTRERDNVVCFPDAPSERAVKHVTELIEAKKAGYKTYVLFVVQMSEVDYFTPDTERHAAFADVLMKAAEEGVNILAYDCVVEPDLLQIQNQLPVSLDGTVPNLDKFYKKDKVSLLSAVPIPLLKWYDINKRDLPWRKNPTPYQVWVSEIMLQQTRVEAVKPYYETFMRELPDIKSLAFCQEERLLKLWEGLGYYNRVRNMQKAALEMVEHFHGQMPETYDLILSLKGIGSYTAGAISSIAYRLPYPAVDGNVLRVLSRLRKDERLISDEHVKKEIESELKKVMPIDNPGGFNQALMELGACVCLPTGAPKCDICPLNNLCLAHKEKRETFYPKKAAKKARLIEKKTVLVLRDENKTVLRKRPKKGLLAGMYEFPMLEGNLTATEVKDFLAINGLKVVRITPLHEYRHIFTHKEWQMIGYMVRVDELERDEPGVNIKDWIYVEPTKVEQEYPIPSAYEPFTAALRLKIGSQRVRKIQDKDNRQDNRQDNSDLL